MMILLTSPRQNPGDSFRRQAESRRRAYAEAQSLRERFPGVEEIVADLAFIDKQQLGVYSAQLRSFSSAAKAFFSIACPRALCLGGGFELDQLIVKLIETHKSTAAGVLECPGCIDPRNPHSTCLLRLNYQIVVRYEPQPPGASEKLKRR
jgi:hypothetical protein